MSRRKTQINILIMGHVNSGKSTSIGHLIYNCTSIDKKIFEELEKESTKVTHLFHILIILYFSSIDA